jgi:hypothetical protein
MNVLKSHLSVCAEKIHMKAVFRQTGCIDLLKLQYAFVATSLPCSLQPPSLNHPETGLAKLERMSDAEFGWKPVHRNMQ